MAERLYIIDGTAFAFRSFFAIRGGLNDSKGRPTNAAYGFARVLLKILREEKPDRLVVTFDAGGPTFRDAMYGEYKAQREETPPDLVAQFPMMKKLVEAFGIPMLCVEGVEADDVIGTLARRAGAEGLETVIVSGDKDLLQLVSDRVSVYDPNKGDAGMRYTAAEVRERFGVGPEHVVDVLGLMGDASDNVPGVRGIGEKTARRLLETYGSLDGVYAHLDALKGKMRENLEQDRDMAFLSRELATIKTDVPLDFDLASATCKPLDRARLAEVFAELQFQSLLEDFLPDAGQGESLRYMLVLDKAQLADAIAEMRAAGEFALDTETTSTDPMQASLVGISMSAKARTGYYIPIAHTPEAMMRKAHPDDLFGEPLECVPKKEALALLRPLIEDPAVGKTGHNIKYDMIVLAREGIEVRGIAMDTMVASYLTDPSRLRHNLDEASLLYLKRKTIPIADLIGKGTKTITFDQVPVDRACEYSCEDADVTWRLTGVFRPLLRERELEPLFREVELPLIRVLARMEMAGVAIDAAVFDRLHVELTRRLKALEETIFEEAGTPFQINSPKQLQAILFDRLGLAPKRKTKTGYSTDVDVLEELAGEHPLPAKILEYRSLDKLLGTYVDALPKLVNPSTGRIHTSFNQAVTATGRLSSSDPNLQNIPVRSELGRQIREGFIANPEGMRLISADYSQIELRILAHLSGDKALREAFARDADIHRDTASRIFGVSPESVTPDMRRQAKAVNFGVVYGISAFGLAKNAGLSNSEAARFIEQYFAQYPRVRAWLDETIERARRDGYTTTMLNRRRYVPDLKSSDVATRKAAERATINTPVQGSAADIIKRAMVRLDAALEKTRARMLLQVHDELLVECPAEDVDAVAEEMRRIMENAIALDVPLKVDVGTGRNWADAH
ncbi:MAG TPA: DNA polymerase I [Candidatus Hydrogenedentes bacterium]|nr:DNA polymerase I [Candidatus Hydrogenedentota bacterium]